MTVQPTLCVLNLLAHNLQCWIMAFHALLLQLAALITQIEEGANITNVSSILVDHTDLAATLVLSHTDYSSKSLL